MPFKKFSGGGEEAGVAKSLAVSVEDIDDCPEGDNAYAATQFGKLVGLAKLSQSDRVLCDMFFEVAYSDETTAYKRGLGHAKREASEEASSESGLQGGGVPNKAEAEKILEIKGMSWEEALVISGVLQYGIVATDGELRREGYGSDPGQWVSAKERRKNQQNLAKFAISRDAKGYRAMILRGATRMAASRWKSGAAFLMLFINELTEMTFGQGMGELFLDYCEEYMESHKGVGLYSVENSFDPQILTKTVVSRKMAASADNDAKLEKALVAIETQRLQISTVAGERTALARRVAELESRLSESLSVKGGQKDKGPPGPDNPCNYCKSEEHFYRDCEKRLASERARQGGRKQAEAKIDGE